ncbi:MAG: glycerol-3-phosphate dehydrogenase [Terriglobia bacterium]
MGRELSLCIKRDVPALSSTQFDLAVIGGGINGAATAREAALRGWKVALIEARDFASGTSSRSSKLVHGGLRYLEQGDFRLVREARHERRRLLKLAPHLVRRLPFLLPIYRGDTYSPLKIRVGLSLYDWLGNAGACDRHRFFNPKQTLERVPALRSEGLRAGAAYYDSETDDARLSLENVLDAASHGAGVANYAQVNRFSKKNAAGGELTCAEVEDRLTGRKYEVAAKFWVNATGPWVDRVRSLVPGYDGSKTIRMTKGTHLILPCISSQYALFAPILPGERIFLNLPWLGYSLLGTTDTDYDGDPDAVNPGAGDAEYLLQALNRVLREPLRIQNVLGSFAGLRALAAQPGRSPSANTREYRFHRDSWAANLVTVCGGKLTTARILAEKLIDSITDKVFSATVRNGRGHPSRARPLPGGQTGPFEEFAQSSAAEARKEFGIPQESATRIVCTYGSRWRKVLEPVRARKQLADVFPGGAGIVAAEVRFAIHEEGAVTLEDFLLRRSGLSWSAVLHPELAAAAADIFAAELGWSAGEKQSALRALLPEG